MQRESSGINDTEKPSRAGAWGLMGLEPDTAREIATELHLIRPGETILDVMKDPERNIHIGLRYICILSKRYNGNFILVFAAYNGGMRMADKLLEEAGSAQNVAAGKIPFRESREYVIWLIGEFESRGGDISLPVATRLPNGEPFINDPPIKLSVSLRGSA